MAIITQKPEVKLEVIFKVDESEARALDALVGYGDDAFIKQFYEFLGKGYLEPHEAGLRKFFKSIREMLPCILNRATDARKTFEGKPLF